MNAFEKAVSDAGFSGLPHAAIAHRLSVSVPYVQQLLRGENPISAPIRAKLDALIAAKDNGPVEKAELGLPANAVARFPEPVDLSDYSSMDRFAVIDAQDGTAVLVEIIEPFKNHIAARKICKLLNKERD